VAQGEKGVRCSNGSSSDGERSSHHWTLYLTENI